MRSDAGGQTGISTEVVGATLLRVLFLRVGRARRTGAHATAGWLRLQLPGTKVIRLPLCGSASVPDPRFGALVSPSRRWVAGARPLLRGTGSVRMRTRRGRGTSRAVDAFDEVLRVIASLNEEGVDYVVVGGVGMNIHGILRATEDLDLFLRPTTDNIARLRAALRKVWVDPHIDEIRAEDLCGEYPAVRYGPPEGALYLDLLTRLGEATSYDDLEVETRELEGVPIRVATPRCLHRMKRNTVRPIDRADAAALRSAFDFEEPE